MPKPSIWTRRSMLGVALGVSCGAAVLWPSPLHAKESSQPPMPEYCAPGNYRNFFAYFVRGYDDQKKDMRGAYTWEQIEIRNYQQTEQLLAVARQTDYKAFRLGLDNNWIYVDHQNRHFYDQPEIRISHRQPGDAPIYYTDALNLQGLKPDRPGVKLDLQSLKPDPPVRTLKAQQYAKLVFRDVTDRSFRVDYSDAQYLRSHYAKPTISWIESSEVLGAYVFERRNDCWYLTQDLRVPRY